MYDVPAVKKFDVQQAKYYEDNWAVSTFLCAVWPWTWHIDLKTHKSYQFFKMYSAQSLMSVKKKVLKIVNGEYVFICPIWPLTFHLKINSPRRDPG
jgi:hypothetical protein